MKILFTAAQTCAVAAQCFTSCGPSSDTETTTGLDATEDCVHLRGFQVRPGPNDVNQWGYVDGTDCLAEETHGEFCLAVGGETEWSCRVFFTPAYGSPCVHVGGPDLGNLAADAEFVHQFSKPDSVSFAVLLRHNGHEEGHRYGREEDLIWTGLPREVLPFQIDPDDAFATPVYCRDDASCEAFLGTLPDAAGCTEAEVFP